MEKETIIAITVGVLITIIMFGLYRMILPSKKNKK
jgi:uncharacterized membrane protein